MTTPLSADTLWETPAAAVKRLGRVGSWAPGSYVNKCRTCSTLFIGDKRAMSCLPCAVSALQAQQADAVRMREALEGADAALTRVLYHKGPLWPDEMTLEEKLRYEFTGRIDGKPKDSFIRAVLSSPAPGEGNEAYSTPGKLTKVL